MDCKFKAQIPANGERSKLSNIMELLWNIKIYCRHKVKKTKGQYPLLTSWSIKKWSYWTTLQRMSDNLPKNTRHLRGCQDLAPDGQCWVLRLLVAMHETCPETSRLTSAVSRDLMPTRRKFFARNATTYVIFKYFWQECLKLIWASLPGSWYSRYRRLKVWQKNGGDRRDSKLHSCELFLVSRIKKYCLEAILKSEYNSFLIGASTSLWTAT